MEPGIALLLVSYTTDVNGVLEEVVDKSGSKWVAPATLTVGPCPDLGEYFQAIGLLLHPAHITMLEIKTEQSRIE